MKRYPKIVQIDRRGQIVIPKDIRVDLNIDEGTGFYMYTIINEGILLKKIQPAELKDHKVLLEKLEEKANKIRLKKKNLRKSVILYKKTKKGNLEVIE
jgi:AbrB family looped-hinge helix DNA binding protein